MTSTSILPSHSISPYFLWLIAAIIAIGFHLGLLINYKVTSIDNGAKDKGEKGIEIGLKKIYQKPIPTPIISNTKPPIAEKKTKPTVQKKQKSISNKKSQTIVKKKTKPLIIPETKIQFEPEPNADNATKNFAEEVARSSKVEEPITTSLPSVLGGGNPQVKASYETALAVWLARYKRYPSVARRRGQEGLVEIEFTIDKNGKVLSHKIVTPSEFKALNKATLKMVKRASPLPAVPEELRQGKSRFTYTIPVNFSLR